MGTFNWFGAVENDVANMFTSNSYLQAAVISDMGGTAVIDTVLNRLSREVAETFDPRAYRRLMTYVEAEILIRSAKGGETSGTMTLAPVVANSVHVWRSAGQRTERMELGYEEYPPTAYTVLGQVITPSVPMVRTEYLYASYKVNVEDPTFSMPSVADKVILGAAAELGERLYVDANQPWPLVETIKARWNAWKATALESRWVPDELRRMDFWESIDRANDDGGSVRFSRA